MHNQKEYKIRLGTDSPLLFLIEDIFLSYKDLLLFKLGYNSEL